MNDSMVLLTALSVLFAALAAAAAWKSAGAARRAIKAAEESELRMEFERAVMTAKDCSHAQAQISALEQEMRSAVTMSQVARGIRVNADAEPFTQHASARLRQANELCEGLPDFLPPRAAMVVKTAEDAHAANVRLGALLRDLNVIRDDLQVQIAKVNEGTRDARRARFGGLG